MRAWELKEATNTGFQCYVDLDGVLVDFEKGVSEFMADDSWGDDFIIQGYVMGNAKQSGKFWKKVAHVNALSPKNAIGLWSNLDWMTDGKMLWNFIKSHRPIILSSPGTSSRPIIEAGKTIWIERNLKPKPPYIFEPKKFKYAQGKPGIQNILIDDSKHKLDPWIDAGGIGILHTDAASTISALKEWGF